MPLIMTLVIYIVVFALLVYAVRLVLPRFGLGSPWSELILVLLLLLFIALVVAPMFGVSIR